MQNIESLQKDQIVRVHNGRFYEDAIINHVDYDHDEIEVSLANDRYRMVGVADVELPR